MKTVRYIAPVLGMILFVGGLASCKTPPTPSREPHYLAEDEPGMTSEAVDFYDYDLVVKKMVSDLVVKLEPNEMGQAPVVTFGPLYNRTPYDIDQEQLMDDIRIEILSSGKARFTGATDINRKGGESGNLWKQLEFQTKSGLVNPATAKQFGQVIGADYILFGKVYHQERSKGGNKEVTYQFTLSMQEVETGLVTWSARKRIRKGFPRR